MNIKIKGIESGQRVGVCIFCNKQGVEGVNILKDWICDECYQEIVNLDVEDSNYDLFVEKIKNKLIYKLNY